MSNPYDVLGVSKDASDDEIKKAYRKLAHKHHPDKDGGDETKFKEANSAYQILSNKEKRAQYDQFGQTFEGGAGPGAGGFGGGSAGGGGAGGQGFEFNFGGGSGFDDIFSDVFGGRGGAQHAGRGRDIQMDSEITFAEMVSGVTKDLELYKATICENCDGGGGEKDAKEQMCAQCKGAGHIQKHMQTMLGTFAQNVVCDTCHGRGKTFDKVCSVCDGEGRTKTQEKINVDIPAGISSGQTISLQGKGEAGQYGAPAGDLFVTVHVSSDERLVRDGDNIRTDEHVSFATAALGDKIPVDTVEGTVTMKVPAGTQSGDVYRIRDKGVPHLRSGGRGDHLVKVTVDVPTKLDRKTKKLIEQLRALDI